jgi:hypothetical protein
MLERPKGLNLIHCVLDIKVYKLNIYVKLSILWQYSGNHLM